MFVNTNVAAMNAWLNLSNTQADMTNVLGQLSSGLKINSAADNPAGLAIAQQMQSEVSGMNQDYQNAQTGINLFQTADSALGQIQSILQSMRSLASQAATGTNNSTDLNALQAEMNQYTQQISQVTNDTNFNTLNLLGGAFQGQSIQIGADQNQALAVGISAADAYSLGVTGVQGTITTAGNVVEAAGLAGGQSVNAAGVPVGSYTLAATVTPWNLSGISGTTADLKSLAGSYNSSTADTVSMKVVSTAAGGNTTVAVTDGNTGTTTDYTATTASLAFNNVAVNGSTMTLTLNSGVAANDTLQFTVNPTSTAFSLSGAAAGSSTVTGAVSTGAVQSISVGSGALSFGVQGTTAAETSASYTATYASGTTAAPTAPAALTSTVFDLAQSGAAATSYTNGTGNALATTGIDITTQADAQAALTVLGNAINTVSNQRATIGAYQNRLQFAASDLQASSQNLTSARAQIMDADIASGMSQLTRDQILQQAGVGMLAQANAMPQALLKLIP